MNPTGSTPTDAGGRRLRPMGRSAVLVECDPAEVLGLLAALDAAGPWPEVVDVVPAASTLLVLTGSAGPSADLLQSLAGLAPLPTVRSGAAEVRIPVIYDGADLTEVAARTGLGVGEVIERHHRAEYVVAFCGFAPGFAYLQGLDPTLEIPRRDTPRTRVPAGSVAIAAAYSAVYPGESPGGWHLLGRTDLAVFDVDREPAALLAPGTVVHFVPDDDVAQRLAVVSRQPVAAGLDRSGRAVEVVDPGGLALVQDLGRPGHGRVAVGRSGAFDRAALALANRLVGNPNSAAGIECLGGGLRLRAVGALTVAVTGADVAVSVDGRVVDVGSPVVIPAGGETTLGRPRRGLRSYVAVRGGLAVDPVLGSAARDTLASLGPAPLRSGDVVAVGSPPATLPGVDHVPTRAVADVVRLGISRGPRLDWFDPMAWPTLTTAEYIVSSRSNRVGIRLDGPQLARSIAGELAPEGMVRGAIQVPPDGRPVVLGPDHPVTGGYPVIAVVDDVDVLAQCPPGTTVRFHRLG